MKIKNWDGCPIRFAAGVWGDKWSMVILRDLILRGRHYFGEFQNAEEGISPNILADRLAKLVENEIVKKEQDTENLAKVIYRLTPKGLDLIPIMLSIIEWSHKYDKNTITTNEFLNEYKKDRVKFEKKIKKAREEE